MAKADYSRVRAEAREIVNDVIRPNAERVDREGIFPRDKPLELFEANGE